MKQQSSSRLVPVILVLAVFAGILLMLGARMLWRNASGSGAGAAVSTPANAPALPVVNADPAVVYEAHFDQGAGQEWSSTRTARTKDRSRTFLGPFVDESVELILKSLPPHRLIRLQFELMTSERWNGDSVNFGRDVWDMSADSQPLIHTTFSNCGFFDNNNEQSFPDQYPWYPTHPAWTGAAARQSLGYRTSQQADSWGDDSTYAFDLTFPHGADKLDIIFQSEIKRHENKPFGLLSFKVTTVEHAAPADEQTLADWWNDLAGEDPIKAYHAVWSLVATGDTATSYIRDRLPPEATGANAPPLNIDQDNLWHYGCFEYSTAAQRQRARAIHVLEVIHSPQSTAMLEGIGYQGTPFGAPPDMWDKGN